MIESCVVLAFYAEEYSGQGGYSAKMPSHPKVVASSEARYHSLLQS